MTGEPLDWRRIRHYLSKDIAWMRGRLALGDIESALYTIRVVRRYLSADIDSLTRFS